MYACMQVSPDIRPGHTIVLVLFSPGRGLTIQASPVMDVAITQACMHAPAVHHGLIRRLRLRLSTPLRWCMSPCSTCVHACVHTVRSASHKTFCREQNFQPFSMHAMDCTCLRTHRRSV